MNKKYKYLQIVLVFCYFPPQKLQSTLKLNFLFNSKLTSQFLSCLKLLLITQRVPACWWQSELQLNNSFVVSAAFKQICISLRLLNEIQGSFMHLQSLFFMSPVLPVWCQHVSSSSVVTHISLSYITKASISVLQFTDRLDQRAVDPVTCQGVYNSLAIAAGDEGKPHYTTSLHTGTIYTGSHFA